MKVYIQCDKNHIPCTINFYSAYLGFKEMGVKTILFHTKEELQTSHKEDIIAGYVYTVRNRLYDFGIITPDIDYPNELETYLGRKIWSSTIDAVNNSPKM